jgi:uncharacterized membrane protein
MNPVVMVTLLWVLFGGSHVALAALRPRLVTRLGEMGFTLLFSIVASVSFTALVMYYAAHRFEGPAGFALGGSSAVRWTLMTVVVLGVALNAPALVSYPRMPMALFGQPIQSAYGIERITRHPFFAGAALFALAHMLLATRLVGTVFFAGLLTLAVVGAWHQDRKLLARRGTAYGDYLAATSTVPFVAIAGGRQRLIWSELPVKALAVGALIALVLRYEHDVLFADGGIWIAATVVGGGTVAGINAWRRARRRRGAALRPHTAGSTLA